MNIFNLPSSCLYDMNIPKEAIYKTIEATNRQKQLFINNVSKMRLSYLISKETSNIDDFNQNSCTYIEIDIITIELKKADKLKDISELIFKAIPKPLVLIFVHEYRILIYTSLIRDNESDSSKVVHLKDYYTDWINVQNPNEYEKNFLDNINIEKLNMENLHSLYEDINSQIINYNATLMQEDTVVNSKLTDSEIEEITNKILLINQKINAYDTKIKEESQTRKKVELQDQRFNLIEECKNLKKKLKGD